jgi:hypothetical protein
MVELMINAKEGQDIELKHLVFAFGLSDEEAVEYFKGLGVSLSDNWMDTWEAIKKDALAIAGIKNMDQILYAHDQIQKAMEADTPLKDFKKDLADKLSLKEWHSSLVISQNISNAHAAGTLERQLNTSDDFPFLRPVTILDKKTTKICSWLSTQKFVISIKDKGLKNMYHPRHFRCRTFWVVINDSQRKRMNLEVKKVSDIPQQNWNQVQFRRLPNVSILSGFDLSKYPKEMVEQFNKENDA